MSKSKTKLLGAQVSPELHALAHMTARLQNESLSDWLRNLVVASIDPRTKRFFFEANALTDEQK